MFIDNSSTYLTVGTQKICMIQAEETEKKQELGGEPLSPVKTQRKNRDELLIATAGAGGVGAKSCLIKYLLFSRFDPSYDPTIEDAYRKQFDIDGRTIYASIFGLLLFSFLFFSIPVCLFSFYIFLLPL